MKILHTSDWHIGRSLYGKTRYREFELFFEWLLETIQQEKIDALLVAGDIFDTSTPSNRAQELYYRFLFRLSQSACRHVVITAGNHDSPTFLNAPKELLRALNVHVVGAITEVPEDELLLLSDGQTPQALICAVPYLRDKDIRTVEAGESFEEKGAKLAEGIRQHYRVVCALAESRQQALREAGWGGIPIIGMGHLFTAGGESVEGDAVRELYVGTLAHIEAGAFPPVMDYLALGHLHTPQIVGENPKIRYCGSPIPMGYGEVAREKKVVTIEFDGRTAEIQEITIPRFQELLSIRGTLEEIVLQLKQLKQEGHSAWLEIEYTGNEVVADLRDRIEGALAGSAMEVRRIKNRRIAERLIRAASEKETLDDLGVTEVFERCLDAFEVPQPSRPELMGSYLQIVQMLREEDSRAE